jgi:hypothetical protein
MLVLRVCRGTNRKTKQRESPFAAMPQVARRFCRCDQRGEQAFIHTHILYSRVPGVLPAAACPRGPIQQRPGTEAAGYAWSSAVSLSTDSLSNSMCCKHITPTTPPGRHDRCSGLVAHVTHPPYLSSSCCLFHGALKCCRGCCSCPSISNGGRCHWHWGIHCGVDHARVWCVWGGGAGK